MGPQLLDRGQHSEGFPKDGPSILWEPYIVLSERYKTQDDITCDYLLDTVVWCYLTKDSDRWVEVQPSTKTPPTGNHCAASLSQPGPAVLIANSIGVLI
jgi:hypothetical protein